MFFVHASNALCLCMLSCMCTKFNSSSFHIHLRKKLIITITQNFHLDAFFHVWGIFTSYFILVYFVCENECIAYIWFIYNPPCLACNWRCSCREPYQHPVASHQIIIHNKIVRASYHIVSVHPVLCGNRNSYCSVSMVYLHSSMLLATVELHTIELPQ